MGVWTHLFHKTSKTEKNECAWHERTRPAHWTLLLYITFMISVWSELRFGSSLEFTSFFTIWFTLFHFHPIRHLTFRNPMWFYLTSSFKTRTASSPPCVHSALSTRYVRSTTVITFKKVQYLSDRLNSVVQWPSFYFCVAKTFFPKDIDVQPPTFFAYHAHNGHVS